jgi:hypothetical protein
MGCPEPQNLPHTTKCSAGKPGFAVENKIKKTGIPLGEAPAIIPGNLLGLAPSLARLPSETFGRPLLRGCE